MIKLVLGVEHDEQEYSVKVKAATIEDFENEFDETFYSFIQNMSAKELHWLAWRASLNQNITSEDDYEKWKKKLDFVTVDINGEEHPKDQDSSDNASS